MSITASEILEALIAATDDNKIWASELALHHEKTSRRVDFWTLEPVRSKGFRAQAYEIKVTRADFQRDTVEKQSGALQYADRFWYVTPPDLLRLDETPEWAGLLEWTGKKFEIKRKAPPREKVDPTWPFLVSLLRNCGEMRRDVGLLKAELAFYRSSHARDQRIEKLKKDIFWEGMIAKSKRSHATPRAIP
jgi:hypothetical protein